MLIYVGIPQNTELSKAGSFKKTLTERLKMYYGSFSADDINLFRNNEQDISVSVMDNAKFPGHDGNIVSDIKKICEMFMPNVSCNVRLNVRQTEPGFDPCTNDNKITPEDSDDSPKAKKPSEEFDYERLSQNYHSENPRFSFDQVILPDKLREQIIEAVSTIQVEQKVFDEWGLRSIIPNASSAISFYGSPGTGKSMAAEAIAQYLGKKILRATYADIESKFHGEGPKMVKAIFRAAERDGAVLFLDESDSLLSKRLTNVSDGSAQAINSMRSQLLICLEQFKGIVIFATNLVVNYDRAFLSRLINIEFTKPDAAAREAIWNKHLRGDGLRIPLGDDVDTHKLSEEYEFCGREIRNSVKDACVTAAVAGRDIVTQSDLIKAAEKTKVESERVMKADDYTQKGAQKVKLSEQQEKDLKDAVQKQIDSGKVKTLDEISSDSSSVKDS